MVQQQAGDVEKGKIGKHDGKFSRADHGGIAVESAYLGAEVVFKAQLWTGRVSAENAYRPDMVYA